MFTLQQIKEAHAKVKTGADFPNYVKDITALGVLWYETAVSNGNTIYVGDLNHSTESGAKYAAMEVKDNYNETFFKQQLKAQQQGETTFPEFCGDCAQAGVAKWIVDIKALTCTYYDKAGNKVLTETIPI